MSSCVGGGSSVMIRLGRGVPLDVVAWECDVVWLALDAFLDGNPLSWIIVGSCGGGT